MLEFPFLFTNIQVRVEQNMSEGLSFAQDGVDQDDDWIVFYVLVHWLLAGTLKIKWEQTLVRKDSMCNTQKDFLFCHDMRCR